MKTKIPMLVSGVFHNRIKNYMSVYFTGDFMDFAPYLRGDAKYQRAPDMIYSFKNIGKAEITGLQAEVQQKFGKYWSAKLGYTYLHAINKSDPSMPRQLLDKPMHKVDIGITYDNPKSGWNGSIWGGDYYINMLDSNTLNNGGNYWPDILSGDAGVYKKQVYEKKTFGIWNVMVQKRFNKNAMMYFGINNIFNHRDDDRATQERVYRVGVNLKFGGGESKTAVIGKANGTTGKVGSVDFNAANGESVNIESAVQNVSDVVRLTDFIRSDFDTSKERGITMVGDYRTRWMLMTALTVLNRRLEKILLSDLQRPICTMQIVIALNNDCVSALMHVSMSLLISPLSAVRRVCVA